MILTQVEDLDVIQEAECWVVAKEHIHQIIDDMSCMTNNWQWVAIKGEFCPCVVIQIIFPQLISNVITSHYQASEHIRFLMSLTKIQIKLDYS
jgi:hypothetical protein